MAGMKLAGKDISDLTRQYQKLDRQIKGATEDQEALNRQLAKAERRDKWKGRAAAAPKFAGRAAWGAAKGVAFGSAVPVALAASAIQMNANSSEKIGLARSYGVGVEKYAAWENIGKKAGLNGENVGDLTEELTNKIGEQGNEKTLNPMLAQLNLSKNRMAGWSREKQFDEVMSRISRMKDDKQASSLADQLMGGEANKIMTYMRLTGKTWEQTMAEAKKSNLLTQEGAEGAARAHFAVTNLWGSVSSGLADTLGKMSSELAPEIDKLTDGTIKWFNDHQAGFVDGIKDWAKKDENGETGPDRFIEGAKKLGEGVLELGKIVWAVAKKLSWILESDKKNQGVIDEYIKNGNSYEGAKYLASDYGLDDWFKENYTPEKVAAAQKAAASDDSTPEAIARQRGTQQVGYGNYAPRVEISVQAAPGQTPEQVGQSTYQAFKQGLPTAPAGSGAMFDTPG
ncbi:hypothetical protein D3C75_514280 [compost metagenome]